MTEQFKVVAVERKKTKAGKDYLVLTLGDRLVSFFEAADVAVDVEVGHTVTCEVVQKGQFWNGKQLSNVTTGVAAKAPAPAQPAKPAQPSQSKNPGPAGKPAQAGDAERQTLYSMRIPAGNQTFFIDVRIAKNNKPYLTITATQGQGETSKRASVVVFADYVKAFADALKTALAMFEREKPKNTDTP